MTGRIIRLPLRMLPTPRSAFTATAGTLRCMCPTLW
nr:MAG TPA: hypothetical protein [Herelleviridae sp.]